MQLLCDSAITVLGIYLFQRNEFTCLHKNSYTNVYRSLICHSQTLETIQMSFSGWMVKQSMVWNTIQQQNAMNHTDTHYSMDESLENYSVKRINPKRLHTVWFHLYHILEMTKYRHREQISSGQGLREVWGWEGSVCGYKRVAWGIFVVMECSISWLCRRQYPGDDPVL